MLAITEAFVDWTSAPASGPIAYDSLGSGAAAKSGTAVEGQMGSASVAAPTMK